MKYNFFIIIINALYRSTSLVSAFVNEFGLINHPMESSILLNGDIDVVAGISCMCARIYVYMYVGLYLCMISLNAKLERRVESKANASVFRIVEH